MALPEKNGAGLATEKWIALWCGRMTATSSPHIRRLPHEKAICALLAAALFLTPAAMAPPRATGVETISYDDVKWGGLLGDSGKDLSYGGDLHMSGVITSETCPCFEKGKRKGKSQRDCKVKNGQCLMIGSAA